MPIMLCHSVHSAVWNDGSATRWATTTPVPCSELREDEYKPAPLIMENCQTILEICARNPRFVITFLELGRLAMAPREIDLVLDTMAMHENFLLTSELATPLLVPMDWDRVPELKAIRDTVIRCRDIRIWNGTMTSRGRQPQTQLSLLKHAAPMVVERQLLCKTSWPDPESEAQISALMTEHLGLMQTRAALVAWAAS